MLEPLLDVTTAVRIAVPPPLSNETTGIRGLALSLDRFSGTGLFLTPVLLPYVLAMSMEKKSASRCAVHPGLARLRRRVRRDPLDGDDHPSPDRSAVVWARGGRARRRLPPVDPSLLRGGHAHSGDGRARSPTNRVLNSPRFRQGSLTSLEMSGCRQRSRCPANARRLIRHFDARSTTAIEQPWLTDTSNVT
jgi:hypothetical protein